MNRRKFVKMSAGAVALLALKTERAYSFYQSPRIPLFGTPLRGVGPAGIPVAAADAFAAPVTGVTHYTIDIGQFADSGVCPTLGPTTLWGYNPANPLGGGVQPQKHLGGIIVARKGQPIQITFRNRLFNNVVYRHILPVDTTLPGANQAINRTAVHLHGGLVPWISDGGPFNWFDPNGNHGLSFLNNQILNPNASAGSAEYYYPLNQSARFMWYHDHAFGITRLNAYAGVASAMLIRDDFEADLIANKGLPPYIETSVLSGGSIPIQELPIVIQDKIFVGNNIKAKDPLWNNLVARAATTPGSLWYAHTYEPNNEKTGAGRWDLEPGGLPLPDPSCIPEFFGDTMLVNGTVFPQATVQARRYRLRLLNACNARFLNLQLYLDDGSPNGITLDANGKPTNFPFLNAATGDSSFLQIGTEGGFLSKPAKVPSSQPFTFLVPPDPETGQTDPSKILKSLIVAPAERPDLIVDFSLCTPGTSVILYNDAPAPFPSGDDRNDYFPGFNFGNGSFGVGNPANTKHDGFGPNTRVLMRFHVGAAKGKDLPLNIIAIDLSAGLDPFIIDPVTLQAGVPAPPGYYARFLSLNEHYDAYGRLIQILGNAAAPFGSPFEDTATYLDYPPSGGPATVGATTENVKAGDTEVWEIYNATGDVHPMHFHMVNVQILNRQLVDITDYPYAPSDSIIPPNDNELGWKETVPMYPGTVTRVILRFDVPKIVTADGRVIKTPKSPRTGGSEYVWHCHILEHEEHDMMHALVVK